jgi:hypothetical protein
LIELFESKERGPVAPIFFRFRPIGVHAIINYGQSKAEKWPKKYLSEKILTFTNQNMSVGKLPNPVSNIFSDKPF